MVIKNWKTQSMIGLSPACSGVDFPNISCAVFTNADPKISKKTELDCLFCTFGICARKSFVYIYMLVKSTLLELLLAGVYFSSVCERQQDGSTLTTKTISKANKTSDYIFKRKFL